jgi:hypothetical protein
MKNMNIMLLLLTLSVLLLLLLLLLQDNDDLRQVQQNTRQQVQGILSDQENQHQLVLLQNPAPAI